MTTLTQSKIVVNKPKKQNKEVIKYFKDLYKQYDKQSFKITNKDLIAEITHFSEYIASLSHRKSRFALYLLNQIKNTLEEQNDDEELDIFTCAEISEFQMRLETTLFNMDKEIHINRPKMRILAELDKKINDNSNLALATSPAPFEVAVILFGVVIAGFALFKIINHFF